MFKPLIDQDYSSLRHTIHNLRIAWTALHGHDVALAIWNAIDDSRADAVRHIVLSVKIHAHKSRKKYVQDKMYQRKTSIKG